MMPTTKNNPTPLTDRELATVLVALRHWQEYLGGHRLALPNALKTYPQFAEARPLTLRQIDALCDRFNTRAETPTTLYILFHETNSGHAEESDGYVEAVYRTEADAETAKLAAIRAARDAGHAIYHDPDTGEDFPDGWEHDWHVEAHTVKEDASLPTTGFFDFLVCGAGAPWSYRCTLPAGHAGGHEDHRR